jgi:sec-independent protein translocase protein TatC
MHHLEDQSDLNDDKTMPLLEHLLELRRRLIFGALAFFACFLVSFYFANELFEFLTRPLADVWAGQTGRRLIFTALQEKFFTNVRLAFFGGAVLSFPLVAAQLWMFVAPGLYKNEKRVFFPFLFATPVMFAIGASLVYYFVLPVAWKFFTGFEQLHVEGGGLPIQLEPKVAEYLSLVMQMIFGFGLVFELPVLLTLLVAAGILSTEGLARNRRYAIVGAFVVAAVLTPPDPISQVAMAVPIVGLYEISIWIGKLIERDRRKREAAEDSAEV